MYEKEFCWGGCLNRRPLYVLLGIIETSRKDGM